jgi:hypothetical protein
MNICSHSIIKASLEQKFDAQGEIKANQEAEELY